MDWSKLVGKKIVAFRGWKVDNTQKPWKPTVPLSYILFDDKETIMEFSEQSPYDYHDCCESARSIDLIQDAALWQKMYDKEGGYEEANDLASPF